jgi:aldose 1-epimerase
VPIFRRWPGESRNPRTLSCNPMLPWFNRISGGGISFGGRFYPIARNDPLEPFPLHGDGWISAWNVVEQAPGRVVLRLRSRAIPPFDYEATQIISLAEGTLDIGLTLQHCGEEPLPYGIGQHPWFVRTPGVTLRARASGVWLEQPPAFPQSEQTAVIPEKWDFNTMRPLPDDFIDNGFDGWDGSARIEWTDGGVAVDIESDSDTRYCHVYSLGEDCPIFCFEPVTHPNNAYAKPGGAAANGLRVLAKGETTSLRVRFTAGIL